MTSLQAHGVCGTCALLISLGRISFKVKNACGHFSQVLGGSRETSSALPNNDTPGQSGHVHELDDVAQYQHLGVQPCASVENVPMSLRTVIYASNAAFQVLANV